MPNPLDPFAFPDPFNAAAPIRRTQQPPPLQPEEEASLLDKIGAAGLGGLSFIGGILNKPGRIVRGLLGGTPREALNAIPFSDALGITRPEDEVRGTDLLRNLGVHNEQDPSLFSPEGAAGFGVDLLTDPLSYLSFGGHALTRLGSASKKAGMLPKTVAARAAGLSGDAADALAGRLGMESSQVAGQALGGHIGVGLPFGLSDTATADLGPLANRIAGAVRSVPGGNAAANLANNLGRTAKDFYTQTIPPLFQGSVAGRTTEIGQDIARNINERTPGVLAQSRMEIMPLAEQAAAQGLHTPEASAAIRQSVEAGTGLHSDIADPLKQLFAQKLAMAVEDGRPAYELAPQAIQQGEGAGKNLGFFPRQATETDAQYAARTRSLVPETEHARGSWNTGLTTQTIHDIDKAELGAMARTDLNPAQKAELAVKRPDKQFADGIYQKYLRGAEADANVQAAELEMHSHKVANNGVVTDPAVEKKLLGAQAEQTALRRQAQDLGEMKAAGKMPSFENHALVDAANYLRRANMNHMKSEELYKGIAKGAVQKGEGTVPMLDAVSGFWHPMEHGGESVVDAGGNLIGHTPPSGATVQLEKALKESGWTGSVFDAHIPKSVADDIAGFSKMQSVTGLSAFAKIWDNITNVTKAYQTFTPSTVIRNAGQDVFNKIVYNRIDPNFSALDPRRVSGPISDWMKMANGGVVEGAAKKLEKIAGFAGLTDEQAAQQVRRLYTAWDVGREGAKRTAIQEGADIGAVAENGLKKLLPISEQANPVAAYGRGIKEGSFLHPLSFSGVAGQTEDVFAPVKAMRAANNASDNAMRGSSFLAGLYQGEEPAVAFQNMMKAHYDFGNLSQFERNVMRRGVPFYSWARQNIPAVIDEISTNPGGKLATAIKGTERAKGEHPGFIPGYVREGVAAPIGGEENGTQRYLTHLGLGFEDLGQMFGPGGPMGMLNPLIKAPIEAATGRQLFTGRDLRDLHSRIGDLTGTPLPAMENVAMNSPAGRSLSILGTLADERKSPLDKLLNLTTGARLSDVNVAGSRQAALRDYIQTNLHGPAFRHFDELSVRPDDLAQLSPQEMELYRLYRSLGSRGAAR